MLIHIRTISRNTFVESVRQPIFFILIGLAGLAILFTTWTAAFSMGYSDSSEVSGDNKMLLDVGLATVFVTGMLLAAFLATAVISKEIEQKTVLTVISKPVSRTSVVIGKYLGVAGAIGVAAIIMLLFMQMGIRHQVMSTAADKLDGPVLAFTFGAVALSVGVATWGNFFYGWVWTQTATLLLLPLMILAWIGILLLDKEWAVQPILKDFKPQIFVASVCIVLALLVLTSVAVAASARLGQVMTIVVCCAVFVGGLMSNHFLGSRAIVNDFAGRILEAKAEMPSMETLRNPADRWTVKLEIDPRSAIRPGSAFHYGPNPSGYALASGSFDKPGVDVNSGEQLSSRARPAALVVISQSGKDIVVQRIGGESDVVPTRPPRARDYVFLQKTAFNPVALGAWGIVPNVQFFWLVDAVTQNAGIPVRHLLLVGLYALTQIGVFLSLAVVLFQKREVG